MCKTTVIRLDCETCQRRIGESIQTVVCQHKQANRIHLCVETKVDATLYVEESECDVCAEKAKQEAAESGVGSGD